MSRRPAMLAAVATGPIRVAFRRGTTADRGNRCVEREVFGR